MFWDWRIPHANSRFHRGKESREVIYAGYLPSVKINKLYVDTIQLPNYKNGIQPGKLWHKTEGKMNINNREIPEEFEFSPVGRKCMGKRCNELQTYISLLW